MTGGVHAKEEEEEQEEPFGEPLEGPASRMNGNEIHIFLKDVYEIPAVCQRFYGRLGYRFAMLLCTDDRGHKRQFTLRYVFEFPEKNGRPDCFVFVTAPVDPGGDLRFPSIIRQIPSARLYEREVADLFGLVPVGNPDTRRLVLHELGEGGTHPLRKDFALTTRLTRSDTQRYEFLKVDGEGVFEIPVGPVHAGIIEPGHFRFSVLGENIINLETRLFYTHKGVEKLIESKSIDDALLVCERVAGDESVAMSTAYCQAIERMAGARPPRRAELIRTICAEMERTYNHLGTLAGIVTDVGFAYGSSRLSLLKEAMMQLNERVSGSRLLFGVNRVGGVWVDLTDSDVTDLQKTTESVREGFESVMPMLKNNSSVVDRLRGTGTLTELAAKDLQVLGIAARSAGMDVDTRRDHPYAAYEASAGIVEEAGRAKQKVAHEVEVQKRKGDALARFNLRADEVAESLALFKKLSAELEKCGGALVVPGLEERLGPYANALGYSESHRGQTLVWVMLGKDAKSLHRCKIRTASFSNWPAIEQAVLNDIVPDFPLVNKSLDLSYTGNDL